MTTWTNVRAGFLSWHPAMENACTFKIRRCAYCAEPRGPLERVNLIYGGSLRDEVEAWLADHQ